MVAEVRGEHLRETWALRHIAGLLRINAEALRLWMNRAQVDAGKRPGVTIDETEEIKRLKRANAEIRCGGEILKSASVFFG